MDNTVAHKIQLVSKLLSCVIDPATHHGKKVGLLLPQI